MGRDHFFWLGQINKASAVINIDDGLLDCDLGSRIARGLVEVLANGDKPNAPRPPLVIQFEPLLIAAVGIEATRLHIGRSSQDMLTTASISIIKDNALNLAEQLHATTVRMVQLAESHVDTLVPNYTNGVAAQPNSYGHYMLGHVAGFLRDAERLEQFYARLDRCPMGTTVLNGTSWPLNRERMAEYLGFSAIADNAYDAVQISATEMPVELGSVCSGMMIHVGALIQDIMVQYAQPRPWILLKEGGQATYVSSAMPQKRNPGILNRTRANASKVIALGFGRAIQAHNIPPGMVDAKGTGDNIEVLRDATTVLKDWKFIMDVLIINSQRALEELNSDWTASQELADVLMRKHGIPFRAGHHFASEIVTYARAHDILPSDFPYSAAQSVWSEMHDSMGTEATATGSFPMSEEEFWETLNPAAIVRNRATRGGPQPAEMERMLANARSELEKHRNWIDGKRGIIEKSIKSLETDFNKLL
ncbi:argininosuccinate lyase [Xylariales sp. PMI_506]|nr:argininosuccinate lyase [Xylariales sp. PMI_506]